MYMLGSVKVNHLHQNPRKYVHIYTVVMTRLIAVLTLALLVATTTGFSIIQQPKICHRWVTTALASTSPDSSKETKPTCRVSIEYCTGCRWQLKAFWIAQELLTTFTEELDAVTMIPSRDTQGNFVVKFNHDQEILWDRKEKQGFPETKVLKQMIRDLVNPDLHLGHSDTAENQAKDTSGDIFSSDWVPRGDGKLSVQLEESEAPKPAITIHYCNGCRWLLRAAYVGQELLTTFSDEINSVTLVPSKPPAKGGRFTVELNGEELFDRSTEGRFPEVKELKQKVRDQLVPNKDLGHSDTGNLDGGGGDDDSFDYMDDDDAEEARRMYGVA